MKRKLMNHFSEVATVEDLDIESDDDIQKINLNEIIKPTIIELLNNLTDYKNSSKMLTKITKEPEKGNPSSKIEITFQVLKKKIILSTLPMKIVHGAIGSYLFINYFYPNDFEMPEAIQNIINNPETTIQYLDDINYFETDRQKYITNVEKRIKTQTERHEKNKEKYSDEFQGQKLFTFRINTLKEQMKYNDDFPSFEKLMKFKRSQYINKHLTKFCGKMKLRNVFKISVKQNGVFIQTSQHDIDKDSNQEFKMSINLTDESTDPPTTFLQMTYEATGQFYNLAADFKYQVLTTLNKTGNLSEMNWREASSFYLKNDKVIANVNANPILAGLTKTQKTNKKRRMAKGNNFLE